MGGFPARGACAMSRIFPSIVIGCFAVGLAACGEIAKLPFEAGTGPQPQIPPPTQTAIPTVNIAPAKGWPAGEKPAAAAGTAVAAFATDLEHPRWVYVLPNGDVLVAESAGPPRETKGI